MSKRIIILLFIVTLIMSTGCARNNTVSTNEIDVFGTFTLKELQDDAVKLKTIINAYSAKLYTDEVELNQAYDKAYSSLKDGMTGLEFIRAMKPVVASLRCGHTHIFPDGDFGDANLLPMDIEVIDGKLYMSRCAVNTDIPLGSEILEINGRTAEGILATIMNGMSADGYNETSRTNFLGKYFVREYAYHIEYVNTFDITFITPDGKTKNESLSAMKADTLNRKLGTASSKAYKATYYDNYALMTVATFNPSNSNSIEDFNKFFDEFFLKVKEQNINNIILDVRGNGGGDPWITSHLFSYLETEPHPYFSTDAPNYYPGLKDPIPMAENHFNGNTYVLIDGGCFSSTGHLLALLKYQGEAVLIGEESGGSYICTDSSEGRNLPNTNAYFHYSRQAWSVAVDGFEPGRGIMPDIEVKMSIDDYLNKADPSMDVAYGLIQN